MSNSSISWETRAQGSAVHLKSTSLALFQIYLCPTTPQLGHVLALIFRVDVHALIAQLCALCFLPSQPQGQNPAAMLGWFHAFRFC
jgi:hypothetical protein